MRKRLAAAMFAATACASAPAFAASITASVTATIERPIAVVASGALSFGTIVRPSTGTETITLSPANVRSALTTDAVWLAAPVSTVPTFTVSGEGGQTFTLAVDPTVTMTNAGAGGGSLSVTTANNAGCTTACTLAGLLGSAGTPVSFQVGGHFSLPATAPTGKYTGSVNVTATYN